ncbi:hypothetical protein Cgig2_000407 [Carnegiea gigantea]|uniref:Uncharacterized protein n=1 Tax=Carnegiea gigantea TaxID=171969 RepID=A0A9Q1JN98_9CARY|nr:hypothetical protein Cgig2_000407 [Carnegiea gigantea]
MREKEPERDREKSRQKEFSVYVNNIHISLINMEGLVTLTSPLGDEGGAEQGLKDAFKSIIMLNNANIQGKRILVSMANHEKGRQRDHYVYSLNRRSQSRRQEWRRKEIQGGNKHMSSVVRFSQETQNFRQALVGVDTEFEEWLKRSLVYTMEEPKGPATLSSAIIHGYGQCSKICALSSFKFILTFPSEADMEAALNNHEELELRLSDIKK